MCGNLPGLFGWFDEDEAPVSGAGAERLQLIAGFGGVDAVQHAVDHALTEEDFRWAIELASWLVRSELNEHGRTEPVRLKIGLGLRPLCEA